MLASLRRFSGNTVTAAKIFFSSKLVDYNISLRSPCNINIRPFSSENVVPKLHQSKEHTWKDRIDRHKDELVNLLLASVLLIVTLRMLREKGEKHEEEKAQRDELVRSKKELEDLKGNVSEYLGKELPKLAVSFGMKDIKAAAFSVAVQGEIMSMFAPKPEGADKLLLNSQSAVEDVSVQSAVKKHLV